MSFTKQFQNLIKFNSLIFQNRSLKYEFVFIEANIANMYIEANIAIEYKHKEMMII